MTTDVRLTWSELEHAAFEGVKRELSAWRLGRRDAYGADSRANGFQLNIMGATGEQVVAKWRGMYWTGEAGCLAASDVGPLQVRSTYYEDGHLLLHDPDADADVFVLVTGPPKRPGPPIYRVAGWCTGRDGKLRRFYRGRNNSKPNGDDRDCYWVPQNCLRSPDTLPPLEMLAGGQPAAAVAAAAVPTPAPAIAAVRQNGNGQLTLDWLTSPEH